MLQQSCCQNHQPPCLKLVSFHLYTATAISSYRNTSQASLYDCQMLMQMGARVGKAGCPSGQGQGYLQSPAHRCVERAGQL